MLAVAKTIISKLRTMQGLTAAETREGLYAVPTGNELRA